MQDYKWILELNINIIWILFIIISFFMIISSILIPRILINLLKKFKISPIFIGVFFLSIITSIPEILSVYFFTLKNGKIMEAMSNIWGANFLSITFICLLDLIYFRYFFFKKKNSLLNKTSFIVLLFNFIFFISSIWPFFFNLLNIKIYKININFLSIFIILFYFIFLFYLEFSFRHQEKSKDVVDEKDQTNFFKIKKNNKLLFLIFLVLVLVLVFSMIFLILLSEKIKNYHNIDENKIGGLLFASITSSPEIWSAISFFQIGLGLAAAGTILGSHLFNVVIFMSVDFFTKEQIMKNFAIEQQWIFFLFIFLNSFLLFINIIRPISIKKIDYFSFPVLIILFFILGWTILFKI